MSETERKRHPRTNSVVEEYDARRCQICGVADAPFGFGPPLTRPGATLWACSVHRVDVDGILTARDGTLVTEQSQPSLL
jgi:hypothetical protein